MYLMDKVTQTGARLAQARPDLTLRGYTELARLLQGTPRFLLDANATKLFVELNLGRPKVLREAMAHLRVPYRRMWVEWDDADRQKLRDKLGENYADEIRPMPGRVGFLLEADEAGRRGRAIWAWDTPRMLSEVPNVGAVECWFDLDQVHPLEGLEGLLRGNLARMWDDNPVQLEALLDIWRTCVHRPASWAPAYWAVLPAGAREHSYADVVGEYICIWGVLLLFTASRPIVDMSHVDLAKLNKKRRRHGAIPLLDHTRVSLHLTPFERRPVVRGELGYSRKSPRIHMVSSYLARRGTRHWVVQPYMRGQGEQIHRVVNVKG